MNGPLRTPVTSRGCRLANRLPSPLPSPLVNPLKGLAEGRWESEAWLAWWEAHADAVKAAFLPGWFVRLKLPMADRPRGEGAGNVVDSLAALRNCEPFYGFATAGKRPFFRSRIETVRDISNAYRSPSPKETIWLYDGRAGSVNIGVPSIW
jgi:hypothetical protein